jgi:hypothetical protein
VHPLKKKSQMTSEEFKIALREAGFGVSQGLPRVGHEGTKTSPRPGTTLVRLARFVCSISHTCRARAGVAAEIACGQCRVRDAAPPVKHVRRRSTMLTI